MMVGLFFMQALYEGLKGSAFAFLYSLAVVVMSVVVFVHGRRIVREGVTPSPLLCRVLSQPLPIAR